MSLMTDLMRSYGDKIIAAALSASATIFVGLFGYWKLKRFGVNKWNIAEIQDRAQFRKDLLDRVSLCEKQLAESLDRERALQVQNGRQAAEIATLRTHQESQRQDMIEMKQNHKERVAELRGKIRHLTDQLAIAKRVPT